MICKRCNGSREVHYESYSGAMYPSPCPGCRREEVATEQWMIFGTWALMAVLTVGALVFKILFP